MEKRWLKNSEAKCIIGIENIAHILERVLPETNVKHVIITGVGGFIRTRKKTASHERILEYA